MQTNRITFEQAKALKKIGYRLPYEWMYIEENGGYTCDLGTKHPPLGENEFCAITQSEARDWLEEKFNMIIETKFNKEKKFDYIVYFAYSDYPKAGGYDNLTRAKALEQAINSAIYFLERKENKHV